MRVIARALWLLALASLLVGVGAVSAAAATKVKRYRAWTSQGDPVVGEFTERRGECNSSSYASGRSDAWRCFAGSNILDPCFENPFSDREVLCVRSPGPARGPC